MSFQDIYEQDLPIATNADAISHQYFVLAPENSYASKLYNDKMKQSAESLIPNLLDIEKAFHKHPNMLLLTYKSVVLEFRSPEKFEFLESTFEDSFYHYYGIALQKDSEYQKIFNYYLDKMMESGILHNLEQKWMDIEKWSSVNKEFENEVFALGKQEVLTLFVILIFGLVIALLLLVAERILYGSRYQ